MIKEYSKDKMWKVVAQILGEDANALKEKFEDRISFDEEKNQISIILAGGTEEYKNYLQAHNENIKNFSKTHSKFSIYFDKTSMWTSRYFITYDGIENDISGEYMESFFTKAERYLEEGKKPLNEDNNSKEELVDFLENKFRGLSDIDSDDFKFNMACAIYWYCHDYHGGQGSEEYKTLSTLEYRPSRLHHSIEEEDNYEAMQMYQELVDEFQNVVVESVMAKDPEELGKDKSNWIVTILDGSKKVESYKVKDKTEEEVNAEIRQKIKGKKELKGMYKKDMIKEDAENGEDEFYKNFNAGDELKIKAHLTQEGKGLSYPSMIAIALEDGFDGGWDVYDVKNKETGEEFSVYGFSIEEVENEQTKIRRAEDRRDAEMSRSMPDEFEFMNESEDEYEEEYEDQMQSEPDDDDAFLSPSGRLGSKTSVSCGGEFIGEFTDNDEAIVALGDWMEKHKYWPSVWNVSDHGNYSLVSDFQKDLKQAREDLAQVKAEREHEAELEYAYEMDESVILEKRHRARIVDPSKFKSFRTDKDKGGEGVDFIYGIKKKAGKEGGKTELQAITFDPDKFSTKEAKAWLKRNNKSAKFTPAPIKESVDKKTLIERAEKYLSEGYISPMGTGNDVSVGEDDTWRIKSDDRNVYSGRIKNVGDYFDSLSSLTDNVMTALDRADLIPVIEGTDEKWAGGFNGALSDGDSVSITLDLVKRGQDKNYRVINSKLIIAIQKDNTRKSPYELNTYIS